MHRLATSHHLILIIIILISIVFGTALCQNSSDSSQVQINQLVLNIYIDDAGRALINGYVDDPLTLSFLNSSEYTYEEDTRQLYAITGALTSKSRDNWTASFESIGRYEEYHVMLYLPASAKLWRIDCSSGLDYLVFTANESVVAEIHGSEITDPSVNIGYLLSLADVPGSKPAVAPGAIAADDFWHSYTTIALILLFVAVLGLLIFFRLKLRHSSQILSLLPGHREDGAETVALALKPSNPSNSCQQHIKTGSQCGSHNIPEKEELGYSSIRETASSRIPDAPGTPGTLGTLGAPDTPCTPGISQSPAIEEKSRGAIEITSEIFAVMDTLTDKEQSVFKALLRRGGVMTQTEIRYDVDISKSSLSGILTSMERRKIITKKEKGRTNVIELSERFLNIKKPS